MPSSTARSEGLSPAEIYRMTRRRGEYLFNTFLARPFSSLLVYGLQFTAITPNVVTFLSLAIGIGAAWLFYALPGPGGAWIAVGVAHLAYIFDCADGQLARLRGSGSNRGLLLDFWADEAKTYFVFAAVGLRVFGGKLDGSGQIAWSDGPPTSGLEQLLALLQAGINSPDIYLYLTVGGLVLIATCTSMTGLLRRPEFGGSPNEKGPIKRGGLVGTTLFSVEFIFQRAMHYPSNLWIFVALNRLDLFVWMFFLSYAAYFGRTLLVLVLTSWRE